MRTLLMQYQHNGEAFEIWKTDEKTLEAAWKEIDAELRPTEGGWIKFEDIPNEMMPVNGGFNN